MNHLTVFKLPGFYIAFNKEMNITCTVSKA